jgi:hypothetical protein
LENCAYDDAAAFDSILSKLYRIDKHGGAGADYENCSKMMFLMLLGAPSGPRRQM